MDYKGCINASDVPFTPNTLITFIYYRVSFVILIAGFIGNLLAIIALLPTKSIRKKMDATMKDTYCNDVNNYILAMFHLMSLISLLTLIAMPIMAYNEDRRKYGIWITKGWAIYTSDAHYPITNSLVSFTYLLYFIYFGSQLIAVAYPFRYKVLVTRTNVNITMLVTALYCVIWYIPTYKWLEVVVLRICPKLPNINGLFKYDISTNLLGDIFAYRSRNWESTSLYQRRVWTTYEICRELLVNIVPFVGMIVVKLVIIIRRERSRKKVKPRFLSQNTENTNENPNLKNGTRFDAKDEKVITLEDVRLKTCAIDLPSDKARQVPTVSKHVTCSKPETTLDSRCINSSTNDQKLVRLNEAKQHKRTLLILTCQFILLMLPYNVSEIINSTNPYLVDAIVFEDIFQLFSMLRFINLAFSFYIMYGLNPLYQKNVNSLIHKYWVTYGMSS